MNDPAPHMEAVARHLLGEPNAKLSSRTELRYGARGSLAVDVSRGLWHDHETGKGGGVFDLVCRQTGCANGGAVDWMRTELGIDVGAPRQAKARPRVVALYDYQNAGGDLVMQVVRFAPKAFKQRTPDGRGGWRWSVKDVDPVPYHLPQVLKAAEIFICEGEKDCDRLDTLGIVATCNPGGAGKWPAAFARYFEGRHVVILADNDEAGRDHGQDVARKLAGVAASIKVLELPGLPAKGDVSDWLDAGGSTERLLELAEDAPGWEAREHAPAAAAAPDWPMFTYGDPIVSTKRDYLIKGLVNQGDFSAWYGPPKGGKSFVMLDLALHIAAGRSWRGRRVRQGRVLYLALEGGSGIRNRIVAAQGKFGRDPLPFHVLTVPLNLLNGDGLKLEAFIEAKVAELGGKFDLIVLDTLSRSMPGGKENSPEVMSAVVGVLDRLRHATSAHVAAIHHCGKDEEAGLRGHSSLLGAIDLCVFIRNGKIKVEDARDCPEGEEWSFKLAPVTIGQDDEDDPITSCIVAEIEAAEKGGDSARPRRPRGKNQQTVLDAFYKAVSGAADEPPPDPLVPRKACGIWREKWKEAAMPQLTQPDAKQKREAFDDALVHLRDQGFVRHHNGYFWMALGAGR